LFALSIFSNILSSDHQSKEITSRSQISMIRKVVISIIVLAVLIIAIFSYGLYQAQKKPDNSPARFLGGKSTKAENKIIVCIGDSITHGRVSYNYVDLLSQKLSAQGYVLVNAGINSELAYNVLQRLDEIIRCEPDFITILIGTNDANASLSKENGLRAMKNMKLPTMPTAEWFQENLIKICSQLKSRTRAKIALLSLPPIGEDPQNIAYKRTTRYSTIIKEVAAKERVTYLPLHEKITDYLQKQNHQPKLSYDTKWLSVMYKGIVFHILLGRSLDEISSSNGFLIITDFLHLNSRGAGFVAELIEGFVTEGASG
jgi:lysophospholipase L1-like esterase